MSWVEVDGAGWRWVHGLVIKSIFIKCISNNLIKSLNCEITTFHVKKERCFTLVENNF